jgi:transposase
VVVPGLEELSRGELLALVRGQHTRLVDQEARLAEQASRLEALEAELERLRRQASRNSGNSSMPPSSDDQPGRTPPEKKARPAGRKRGKQPGAKGSGLARVADPDDVKDVYPASCGGCGQALDASRHELAGHLALQQIDVPLALSAVTEFRMHRLRCGCGQVTQAPRPAGLPAAPVSYGPNIQTIAVYLLVFHAVPVERVCQLIADLTGARPSPGFVHGMLARVAALLTGFERLVKTLLVVSHVVHFDETTLRVGPRGMKKYVWIAATALYTLFHLGERTKDAFVEFGLAEQFTGIAVHDYYSVYYAKGVFRARVRHQLCTAHIIRHLTDAAECHPGAHWPEQALRALRGLIHAHHQAAQAGLPAIPARIRNRLISELRQAVAVGLSQISRRPGAKTKQIPARNLLECLRDRHRDIVAFCFDTQIPPTNNTAENGLRPQKTQQKISGRLQSEEATRDRLRIRGYLATAAKHGLNVMTVLRDAILGTPWMPPKPLRT